MQKTPKLDDHVDYCLSFSERLFFGVLRIVTHIHVTVSMLHPHYIRRFPLGVAAMAVDISMLLHQGESGGEPLAQKRRMGEEMCSLGEVSTNEWLREDLQLLELCILKPLWYATVAFKDVVQDVQSTVIAPFSYATVGFGLVSSCSCRG